MCVLVKTLNISLVLPFQKKKQKTELRDIKPRYQQSYKARFQLNKNKCFWFTTKLKTKRLPSMLSYQRPQWQKRAFDLMRHIFFTLNFITLFFILIFFIIQRVNGIASFINTEILVCFFLFLYVTVPFVCDVMCFWDQDDHGQSETFSSNIFVICCLFFFCISAKYKHFFLYTTNIFYTFFDMTFF